MVKLRLAAILVLVSVMACAASQSARLQLPPGARIGILNALEPQMTHVDVGTLRVDSFTRAYDVDWDIPGYVGRAIEKDLRARGDFTFVPMAVDTTSGWKQSTSDRILNAVKGWTAGEMKAYLEKTAAENRLDAIVTVSSYRSGTWEEKACFKIGKAGVVDTKGYGLFTRTKALSGLSGLLPVVGQNQATAFANVIVAVFQPKPATLAAYAAAPCSKSSLPDFPWGSDLKSLDPSVIRQVRAEVERLSAEAVRKALGAAGMVP